MLLVAPALCRIKLTTYDILIMITPSTKGRVYTGLMDVVKWLYTIYLVA